MKRTKPDEDQLVLDGTKNNTPEHKAGVRYLDTKEAFETAQSDLNASKGELIKLLVKKGKKSIKCEGQILTWAHKQSDTISSKQAQ